MKTDVCITIDLEFTIGGAFNDPANKQPVGEPSVRCNINGKSHGLGFLLSTFAEHGIQATFFIEVLNTAYFGDEPMRSLAHEIYSAGHDIQLHLHPCWLYFYTPDWRNNLSDTPPNDSLAKRNIAELEEIISRGMDIFRRWELPQPIAVRSGSLHADLTLYKALAKLGIPLSSNIGYGVYQPEDPELHLYSGRHIIHGVTEIPVLTYIDLQIGERKHHKTLTITGSSWGETRALLQAARKDAVSPVVLLTHASEFVKFGDEQYKGITPNTINQRRLVKLCRFLEKHSNLFQCATFSAGAQRWQEIPNDTNQLLKMPPWSSVKRIIENKLNDTFAWI